MAVEIREGSPPIGTGLMKITNTRAITQHKSDSRMAARLPI
jgi:hypothetical protein